MQINSLNNISFGALVPQRSLCDMSSVSERLRLIPNINKGNFADIALKAQENAQNGNSKPQMLVEMMVRFVTGVDSRCKDGLGFHQACKKTARQLYSDFGRNQHKKDTFSERWDFLAKMGSSRKDGYTASIKPDMNPTAKPISFTYTDLRDMFEFLRKNWSRGSAAYRNIMIGKGPAGWLKYVREELFPNHYDEFFRKY